MAGKRSATKHEPKGRAHLAAAPIGTDTRIDCPKGCRLKLAVAEGTGALKGLRVLACPRLGCTHQEEILAATEVALAGGSPLPGLEGREDAMSTATTGEAASGAEAAPASAAGGRSARNGGGKRESRTARLMKRAENPTAPAETSAPRTFGDVMRSALGISPPAEAPAHLRVVEPSPREMERSLVYPHDVLAPSPLNPRKKFDEAALAELAASLRQDGMLQPIVIRRMAPHEIDHGQEDGPRYWIVAGERRWRAAQLAGLDAVPVMIRDDLDDAAHLRLAILENTARRDLDPVEEARAFERLHGLTGQTNKAIAADVGRGESTIANARRLLQLPESVLDMISAGQLGASHGKALLQWAGFPEAVGLIAQHAATHAIASKDLESGRVSRNLGFALVKAKMALEIPGQYIAQFDSKVCNTCPFKAMVKVGEYDDRLCLKPDHMKELKREAKAKREQEEAARLAAEKAAQEGSGQPIVLTALPAYKYADLTRGRPAGCTPEGCPCARTADCGRHPEGQSCKGVAICVDTQRHRELVSAEEVRRADARMVARRVADLHVTDAVADADIGDTRSLATLVLGLMLATSWRGRERVLVAVERWAPRLTLPEQSPNDWRRDEAGLHRLAGDLAALPLQALTRLGLDLICREAMDDHFSKWGDGSPLARWLLPQTAALRDGEPTPASPPAAGSLVRDLAQIVETTDGLQYPFTAKAPCSRCGGEVRVNSEVELRSIQVDLEATRLGGNEGIRLLCDTCGDGFQPAPAQEPEREPVGAGA